MTLIDTSGNYGEGRSEELIKRVIAGQRDRAFVVSKVEADEVTGDAMAQSPGFPPCLIHARNSHGGSPKRCLHYPFSATICTTDAENNEQLSCSELTGFRA